jgi:hypothetical protein
VVLYHCIAPLARDSTDRQEMGMITPPEVLEAHIALLPGLGYQFATAGELATASAESTRVTATPA